MRWFKERAGALLGRREPPAKPRVPEGVTVYAIGDIHGRLDLLSALLDRISADLHGHETGEVILAFLGDYIDRGPASKGVLETLRRLKDDGGRRIIALKGNHEDALLGFLDDPGLGAPWSEHGGRETLLSYGVPAPTHRTDADAWARTRDALAAAVPPEHIAFLRSLSLWEEIGDYLFVHAGVRPGVPLERQEERDLLWIREEFLQSEQPMDKVVVHGHTPTEAPLVARGRIGVDTGAYATGILTALKLQGEQRSFLQTGA